MMPMETVYLTQLPSPLGTLTLASDGEALTGLWMEQQKYAVLPTSPQVSAKLPIFRETQRWLNSYFAGEIPPSLPLLRPCGTPFRKQVWQILLTIAYAETKTYGQIAQKLAHNTHKPVSARAIGGAVSHNPISILIPCHRVIGAQNQLTGYAGGTDRKHFLLTLEQSHRNPSKPLPFGRGFAQIPSI